MLLIELFDRDNILCPEWLTKEFLEDDWQDATYSYQEGYHTWSLDNIFGKLRICFNGNEYHFQALNEDGEWELFVTITGDQVTQY